MCGSYISYNSVIYEYAYNSKDTMSFEWLYSYLSTLGHDLHLRFKYFYFILYGVGLLLLKRVTSRYLGPYQWIFFLMFFLYPLAECRSALRNSMSMFLLLYAFPFLLRGRFKDIVVFISLLIIATGFHRTSFFYFLFLLYIPYKNEVIFSSRTYKIVYYIIIVLSFIACFISSISSGFESFLYTFLDNSDDEALSARAGYLMGETGYGFLLFGGYQVLWVLLLYLMKKRLKQLLEVQYLGAVEDFINLVLFMDIILLPLVIGYKFNGNFFRLFMNVVPLNYMGFILLLKSTRFHVMNLMLILFLLIILIVGIQQSMFSFEMNINSMFVNNWLLQLNF